MRLSVKLGQSGDDANDIWRAKIRYCVPKFFCHSPQLSISAPNRWRQIGEEGTKKLQLTIFCAIDWFDHSFLWLIPCQPRSSLLCFIGTILNKKNLEFFVVLHFLHIKKDHINESLSTKSCRKKKKILTKFGIPGIPQSTICIMMLKRFIQTEWRR